MRSDVANRAGQSAPMRELAAKWRQWTDVVGLFAARADERFSVSAERYGMLYAELAHLCRAQADTPGQAGSDVAAQCREILAPWVTLDALQWTERDIIRNLWDRSRQIEQMLGGRKGRACGRRRAVWLVGAALAAAAFLAALWSGGRAPGSSPLDVARGWLRLAERAVRSAGPEQAVVLGGALVALVVGVVVWRSARGW
jgi:hypothetical protein